MFRLAVDLAEVLLQVHAGRPSVARACQYEHAAVVVGVEGQEDLDHLRVQRRVHRVALVGPVQLDPGDPLVDLDANGRPSVCV